MKPTLVLLAVCCMLATAQDTDSLSVEAPLHSRLPVYAAEFGAGLGGLAVCAGAGAAMFYGGMYATGVGLVVSLGILPVGAAIMGAGMSIALTGMGTAAGVPAGCGLLVATIGDRWHEGGSKWGAIGGGYVGAIPGAGIAYFGYRSAKSVGNGWRGVPFYALAALCVPAGATVGYNLSIVRKQVSSSLGMRLESPGLTFISTELPDHSVEYGVKVQLAGLRF